MLRQIVTNKKDLLKKCEPCNFLELEVLNNKRIIRDLHQTTAKTKAFGLAANQIGENKRILVFKHPDKNFFGYMVNPIIFCKIGSVKKMREGCMSFPGKKDIMVRRYKKIKIKYQLVTGAVRTMDADGLFAQILQHEVDHLNGKTIF